MAKPHTYAEKSGVMVKTHPILPIELTGFITDTYGKDEKTQKPNSFGKALTLALLDLQSLKNTA